MRRDARVLVVLFLFASVGLAATLPAQEAPRSAPFGERDFLLEQNYPNPFNPETRIPFVLDEELFRDAGSATVTLRIYNVLQQFVAAPTALRHPAGEGVVVEELEYAEPGRYEAYWDGRDASGREVASGVYFVQLIVNGRTQVRKMFVTK